MLPLPLLHFSGRFKGGAVPSHQHDGYELLYVVKGVCSISMPGMELSGEAGTCFILPRRTPHAQNAHRVQTIYVVFDWPGATFDDSARRVELGKTTPTRRWMSDLCDFFRAPVKPPSEVIGALLLAVVQSLLQSAPAMPSLHPVLASALRWMQARLHEPMKLPELLGYTQLSASYLSELFRRQFHCGPQAYHQQLRLDYAARLLADPYSRINEIARSCGYEDANFFTRQFQKHHGVSPRIYRVGGFADKQISTRLSQI